MINTQDVLETISMIRQENLDIRTITMGISLWDCVSEDTDRLCQRIYDKITKKAEHLVETGAGIEKKYGIPIVNKRVSVTPVSLIGGAATPEGYLKIAHTLQRAADEVGINFIGGFSALVQKGMTPGARNMIEVIPEALAQTRNVCSSVNVASTKAGINMDAIALMGKAIKKTAYLTRDEGSIGCAKLVVFSNVPEDNPFMAGAFCGIGEPDVAVNVGVSGPGVVASAIRRAGDCNLSELADVIKSSLDTCKHEIVPVFLDGTKTYELDSYVDFGTRGAIVWGDGATIVVSGDGQIATSAYLQFRNANFDCAMAGVAPFAMSKEPDASLKINDEASAIKYEGANQKVFWNEHAITIENCNFANLKTSLFYGNKQPWALHTLRIQNCIAQLEGKSIDPVISFVGASTGDVSCK